MVSEEIVNELRNRLQTDGSAMFVDPKGRKLILVASSHLSFVDEETPSILVAYEGEGSFLWDISQPISPFRLIEAGFGFTLSPTLADILKRVTAGIEAVVIERGTSLPMLSAPQGQEREGE